MVYSPGISILLPETRNCGLSRIRSSGGNPRVLPKDDRDKRTAAWAMQFALMSGHEEGDAMAIAQREMFHRGDIVFERPIEDVGNEGIPSRMPIGRQLPRWVLNVRGSRLFE
jgi:hypothetical protein